MFEKQQNNDKLINNLTIFKGVLFGLVFMLIITTIMALFSSLLFNLKAGQLNMVFLIINFIILSFIGFYVARNVDKNGWLNGGIAGLIYMIILILIGSISMPISISNIFIMTIIALIISSVGGILGINL